MCKQLDLGKMSEVISKIILQLLIGIFLFYLFSSFAFADEKSNLGTKYIISVNNIVISDFSKEKVADMLQKEVNTLDISENSFVITRVLTFPDFSLVFCQIGGKERNEAEEKKIVDFLEELYFVKYVERSTKSYLHNTSDLKSVFNDPYVGQQWYLGQDDDFSGDINYKEAVKIVENNDLDTSNKVVAVIDTGVNKEHEDLQNSLWINNGEIPLNGVDDDNNGYVDDYHGINVKCIDSTDNNCMKNNNGITDTNGHGTAITSIISAQKNNNKGMVGLSDAKVLTCKITVNEYGAFSTNDGILCLNYIYDLVTKRNVNIDALNLSFGQYSYMKSEEDLLRLLSDEGIIIVVASGNEGNDMDITPQYPASYNIANLISVGSINKYGNISSFSNYGENKLDIFAPGEDILAASYDNNTGYTSNYGTSFAAPIVAGTISILKAMYPHYTPEEIAALLISSGQKQNNLLGKSKTGRILKLAKSDNDVEYYGGLTCSNQIEYGLFNNNLSTQMFTHELNNIQMYGMNCADTYEPNFSISGDTDYVMAHLIRDDGVSLASYYPEKTKFLYNIDLSLEKEFSDTDLKKINLKVGNMEKNIYISKLDINIDNTSKNIDVLETQFEDEYYNSIGIDELDLYRDGNINILSCVNVKNIKFPEIIFGHKIEAFKVFANNVIMFYQNYSECIEAQNEFQAKGYTYFGENGFGPYLSNEFMFDDKLYNEVKSFLGDIIVSSGWIDNVTSNIVFSDNLGPYLNKNADNKTDAFGIFDLGMYDNDNNFHSTNTYINNNKIEFAYAEHYSGNNNVVAGIFFKYYPEKNIEINYDSINKQDVLTYTIKSPTISIDDNSSIVADGFKFEKIDGQLQQNQFNFRLQNNGDGNLNIRTHRVEGDIANYIDVSYVCGQTNCDVTIKFNEDSEISSLHNYNLSDTITNELSGEVILLTNDIYNPIITVPVTLSETVTQEEPTEPNDPNEPTVPTIPNEPDNPNEPTEPTNPDEPTEPISENVDTNSSSSGGGGGCSAIPYSQNNSYFIGLLLLGGIISYRLVNNFYRNK